MMTSTIRQTIVAAAALVMPLGLAGGALGGPIETYVQIDLEEPFPQGGFGLSILAQPGIQGEVLESSLDIIYTPDPGADAADFSILIIAPTDDGMGGFTNIWSVTGTDLGWSGGGTASASITSTVLAGMIFPDPDFALWEIALGPNFGTIEDLIVTHQYLIPGPAPVALLLAGAAFGRRTRRRA